MLQTVSPEALDCLCSLIQTDIRRRFWCNSSNLDVFFIKGLLLHVITIAFIMFLHDILLFEIMRLNVKDIC